MGEAQNQPFQLSFNPELKVEFQGSRVTSDGGLILARELDQRLGFSDLIAQHLTDPRGKNTQFPLTDLVRQSVYRRLAGYEDVNDAEPLAHDPTFRLISSETIWERGTALTSRVHSFETELLTEDKNLTGLAAVNRELLRGGEGPGREKPGVRTFPPVVEVKAKRVFAVGSSAPPVFWRVLLAVGWRKPDPEPAALMPSESGSSSATRGACVSPSSFLPLGKPRRSATCAMPR